MDVNWVSKAIEGLLIKGTGELFSRIEVIKKDLTFNSSETKAHFYFIRLDANGNPRKKDLLEFIAMKIVDYSIPKRQQIEAAEYLKTTGSTLKIIELQGKAKALFTTLNKTGELGEMMLYILTEEILKLPKILNKMTLKTSGEMHYHGADAVHFHYNEENDSLDLYWGESKMEQTITSALNNCFQSITPFLTDPNSYNSKQNRDLALIESNISDNINNKDLENFLVRYFDLGDDCSNRLNFKGICFIGFDVKDYPSRIKEKTSEQLLDEFKLKISDWEKSIETQVNKHPDIKKFDINIFLMPFDSVENMRSEFLKLIK